MSNSKGIVLRGIDETTGKEVDIHVKDNTLKVLNSIDGVIDFEIESADYMWQSTDDTSDPVYHGFVRKDGLYYFMKITSGNTAQYFKSDTIVQAYDTAWTARAAKTYTDWDGTA